MTAQRFFLVCFLASLAWSIACASDDAAKKPDAPAGGEASVGAMRITEDTFDTGCCTRRELDLNRDGKPDAYQFTKVIDNDPVVVRKEVDVNFDGKIDLVRDLNDKGALVDERLDTDFDGRIDVVVYFEREVIVRKEYDTNFDAKVDMWRFFDKSVILREEADLNYDGRIDYWEYFEGGKLDRVGIDRDYDGNVDEWLNNAET